MPSRGADGAAAPDDEMGLADVAGAAGRFRRPVVAASLALLVVRQGWSSLGDWPTFMESSDLLRGVSRRWLPLPGGLHLMANYPEYQVGPLSVVVATPFVMAGTAGRVAAGVVMCAVGLIAYLALDRAASASWTDGDPWAPAASLVVGVVVMVAWVPLALGYLHLDDVMAVAAAVGAVLVLRRGRVDVAGVLVGVAVASKPWAVLFVPMLVVVGPWAGRVRALVWCGAIAALTYGPFVIADHRTLGAAKPTVDVSPASVLHLFGVAEGLAPSWVRAVQLGVGVAVVALVSARGRWIAGPMVAVAVRLVFDPGVFDYYTGGLVMLAAVWDLLGSRHRVPWATVVAFVGLDVASAVGLPDGAQAVVRLVTCLAVVALGATGPRSSDAATATRSVELEPS